MTLLIVIYWLARAIQNLCPFEVKIDLRLICRIATNTKKTGVQQ